MSRPRATSSRFVMNLPARRKTDADATGTNQLGRDEDILWKTLILSSEHLLQAPRVVRKP
jgi:hypothetical protein